MLAPEPGARLKIVAVDFAQPRAFRPVWKPPPCEHEAQLRAKTCQRFANVIVNQIHSQHLT